MPSTVLAVPHTVSSLFLLLSQPVGYLSYPVSRAPHWFLGAWEGAGALGRGVKVPEAQVSE